LLARMYTLGCIAAEFGPCSPFHRHQLYHSSFQRKLESSSRFAVM
jgi:hypothetical protein